LSARLSRPVGQDWRRPGWQELLGWRRRTCPKDWRAIRREFDWLGAERGRQLGEVTGIGQTGVGEGYALLCEDGRERIKNRRKSVSAYAAEKLGILQPIQIHPPHSGLAF
jgi:hypothetical protein